MGQVVACEVILENGCEMSASHIRQVLLQRIPAHQVPARISFVEAFAATSSGKKLRRQ